MRIVHSRKKVWNKDYAFQDNFQLLVWILSILKWKDLGHTTVLYTDKETLENIKIIGFDHLYDVIDTDYLEKEENIKNIDFWCFWAMPKILSLKAEIEKGFNSIVSDVDVVPIKDFENLIQCRDVLVWSNKEYIELRGIYPRLEDLSLPNDYEFPMWFTGRNKPLNTGVIYFKDNYHASGYIDEVIRISKNNHNHKNNTRSQTMCNAEQRMLGEYINYRGLSYNMVQPFDEGLFNKNAFHTHEYKTLLEQNKKILFNINFLIAIKKYDENMYNNLINNELFKEEQRLINKHNITNPVYVKELSQYEDL